MILAIFGDFSIAVCVNRLGPHRPLDLHLGMFESEYHNGHSCHLLKCFQNWFSNNHNDDRLDLYYKLCGLKESLHINYHLQVKEIAHTQGELGSLDPPLSDFCYLQSFYYHISVHALAPLPFSESLEPPLTQKSQKVNIPVLYRQTSYQKVIRRGYIFLQH